LSAKLQERVGYLPEDRGLYKKMKVGEQLAFFAELKGIPRQEAHRRSRRVLKRIEMTEWNEQEIGGAVEGHAAESPVRLHHSAFARPGHSDELFSGLDPISAGLFKRIVQELKDNN